MAGVRISGFSSGLDIDAIVKQLMKAERTKLDKLKQNQTSLTWQQDQFREISTSLVDFRNNKLSQYNTLNSMSAKTSQVSGNAAAVSITSTNSGASGSISVSVNNLATSATYLGQTGASAVTPATTMADLHKTGATPKSTAVEIGNGAINRSFAFSESDLVSDVLARINADKELNVTAMVGSNGQISFRSNSTGAGAITVKADSIIVDDATVKPVKVAGKDASYTVNGIVQTSKTNTISVNGYNLLLKAESGMNGESTISSRVDTDAIVSTLKSFIADYNAILDKVNGKLNEQRYRNFSPLTEEQKADMKESEITLWETKAKSGLLKGDSALSSLVSGMRTSLSSTVDTGSGSPILTGQSIGIVTGQWSEHGKLYIEDENKLRSMIESNPDEVIALFMAKPSTAPSTPGTGIATNKDYGIFQRLSTTLMDALTALSDKAGTSAYSSDKNSTFKSNSVLGEQLRALDTKISDMNSYLVRKENQYYKQFTAMETAMNRYSSQSSSFSSFV
ncbi:flagellar filament capping protein FliD [Paenibacillus pasadenensis]|uniref:Flagellar hook-associated protein 2 n=1 Tax=Paenibacillus pasadenensis TaxID=217090 RepID=A0A2N5NDM2_9BACL|nr:flagellar filament capping protein FliD [Paenibacillus pasadenensis]PLT48433.1 Flagellar hook-associated protein FliD [Paenibacillus pasadenensis]